MASELPSSYEFLRIFPRLVLTLEGDEPNVTVWRVALSLDCHFSFFLLFFLFLFLSISLSVSFSLFYFLYSIFRGFSLPVSVSELLSKVTEEKKEPNSMGNIIWVIM